jgi:hypothetical protein
MEQVQAQQSQRQQQREREQQQAPRQEVLAPMLRPGGEGVSSFYRFLIVFGVFMFALLLAAFLLWLMFVFFFNHPLFAAITGELVMIWGVVKVFLLLGAGLAVVWFTSRIVTGTMQRLPKAEVFTFHEDENAVIRGLFGTKQLAFVKPGGAGVRNDTSLAGKVKQVLSGNKGKIAPVSLVSQFEQKLLSRDMDYIVIGFDKKFKPMCVPFASYLLSGITRSGKTRRSLYMLCQWIYAGAIVSVCDPHATKRDGIAPLLEPLKEYIRLASFDGTFDAIMREARAFYDEMLAREAGTSTMLRPDGSFVPWLLHIDEWGKMMTSSQVEKDDKALLIEIMRGCCHEWAGYQGYGGIVLQAVKESNIGDISFREDIPLAICHHMKDAAAKFMFPNEKDKQMWIVNLVPPDCVLDNRFSNEQQVLHACEIPDETAQFFSDIMRDAGYQPAHSLVSQVKAPLPAPGQLPSSPATPGGPDLEARLRMLESLIAMFGDSQARTMPDVPLAPGRTTRPLKEQIAAYPFGTSEGYAASQHNTDELASSNQGDLAEGETEASMEAGEEVEQQKKEPIGRDLVIEQLDKVITGEMSAHDFLKWAEKSGGRKYTARAQAIRQIQQALEGEQSASKE